MTGTMANGEEKGSDFYAVLGLNKECTESDLRNAYKKLAMKWHPDRCSASGNSKFVEESKKKFQGIQQAYSVLSDANKRFLYDIGVCDSDDDENDMGDFLKEMAVMMSQTKSNEKGEESFEELQQLFEEMFQGDIGSSGGASHTTAAACSTSSTYVTYCESSGSNKRNSCEMNIGKAGDSCEFDASFQNFCLGESEVSPLAKMSGLKCFEIYYSKEHHFYLPQGTLASLPNGLRYLRWNECPLKPLPSTFSPEILVELDMRHIKMRELWDGMQNLVNLKHINLSDSKHLMELPDFSKSLNLEEALLSGCSSLSKVHPSILSLHKLEVLVLDWCEALTSLRSDIHLRSLRYLSLYRCSRLKEFSVTSENMTTLNLVESAINELPSSICCMSKLESLNLSGCKRLKNLPSNLFDSLRSLRWLWLDNSCNIFELSGNINVSSSLDRLTINGIAMGGLPESIKHLSSLKFLLHSRCRRLQYPPELPPSIRALSATDCSSPETVTSVAIEWTRFQNCVELDEYSVKAILAYVMVHINKSLSGLENYNPKYNPASLRYLESRVPEWFKYRIAHAGSITIDLSSAPLYMDWGLLFCFIFSPSQRKKMSHIRCTGYMRIIIHQSVEEDNDDGADDNDIRNVFYQMDATNLTLDHVFLCYIDDFCSILRRNKRESKAADNLKILYKMNVLLLDNKTKMWRKHCEQIKECGVCPTYVSEYQNFIKQMEVKSQVSASGMGVGCSY